MSVTRPLLALCAALLLSACGGSQIEELTTPPGCAGEWYDPAEKGRITQDPLLKGKTV